MEIEKCVVKQGVSTSDQKEEEKEIFLYTNTARMVDMLKQCEEKSKSKPLSYEDINFHALKMEIDPDREGGQTKLKDLIANGLADLFKSLEDDVLVFDFPLTRINEDKIKLLGSLDDLSAEEKEVVTKLNKYIENLTEFRETFHANVVADDAFCYKLSRSIVALFKRWDGKIPASLDTTDATLCDQFNRGFDGALQKYYSCSNELQGKISPYKKTFKNHLGPSSTVNRLIQLILDNETESNKRQATSDKQQEESNKEQAISGNQQEPSKKKKETLLHRIHEKFHKSEQKPEHKPEEKPKKSRKDLFNEIDVKIASMSEAVSDGNVNVFHSTIKNRLKKFYNGSVRSVLNRVRTVVNHVTPK